MSRRRGRFFFLACEGRAGVNRRHRQSRRSRLKAKFSAAVLRLEGTASLPPPSRPGILRDTAALAPIPLTPKVFREQASPAVSRRMLPKAPLRRLSRPLLARDHTTAVRAKCRLGHSRLTRFVSSAALQRRPPAEGGKAAQSLRHDLPHRALYDLVRAAGAPAGSGGKDPKDPKAAAAMPKVSALSRRIFLERSRGWQRVLVAALNE